MINLLGKGYNIDSTNIESDENGFVKFSAVIKPKDYELDVDKISEALSEIANRKSIIKNYYVSYIDVTDIFISATLRLHKDNINKELSFSEIWIRLIEDTISVSRK